MPYIPTIKIKLNSNDDGVKGVKGIFSPRVVEYNHNKNVNQTFTPKITYFKQTFEKKPTFQTLDQSNNRIDNHIFKEINEIKKELDYDVDIDGIKNNSDYDLIINKLYKTYDEEIKKVLYYNQDSYSQGAKIVKISKEVFDEIPNKSVKLIERINKMFNKTLYQSGWDGIEPIILSFDKIKDNRFSNDVLWNKSLFYSNDLKTLNVNLSFITGHHYHAVSIIIPKEDIYNLVHHLHKYIDNYYN